MNASLCIEDFTGIWHRQSIAINGEDPYEDTEAYWLQVGDFFVDMRWPIASEDRADDSLSAFAGKTIWTRPLMQFDHHIDFTNEFLDDKGIIKRFDEGLIETGQVEIEGRVIKFVEKWIPLHLVGNSEELKTLVFMAVNPTFRNGYFIRVDRYAIAMYEDNVGFNAACWRLNNENESWSMMHGIGKKPNLEVLLESNLSGQKYGDWENVMDGFLAE